MHTRTKIICTIGPAVFSLEKILELIDAGMNVARINFSHGDAAQHSKAMQMLKCAREMRKVPLAIMLDTKGPEIRVGEIEGGRVEFHAGQKVLLSSEKEKGTAEGFAITPAAAIKALDVGMDLLFADGYLLAKVVEKKGNGAVIEIQNNGVLKTHNNVAIPKSHIDFPILAENDKRDIILGCEHDIDIIAASFIHSVEQILEIKRLLVEQGKSDVLVMAKIENSEGVQNFSSIVQVADGIMVARGDLGIELPLEKVPALQKMMIREAYKAGKPVVTATQMLESMISNPRPTRAEVSDVANAIYDSTSAVMLSGETAMGKYPVETVKMMKRIIEEAEKDFDFRGFFDQNTRNDTYDVSWAVSAGAVKTAYNAKAKAIFAFTSSGSTANGISCHRPKMPIVALTPNLRTYHKLALCWGVVPVDPITAKNVQEAFAHTSCFALQKKLVHYGDLVILTAGSPFGISGTTNMMIVESIGDVLVRGHRGFGNRIHGKVALILSGLKHYPKVRDRIVVLSYCDDSDLPYLEHVLGIVLQNHPDDHESEQKAVEVAKALNIPIVTRADGALSLLKDGQLVTLDPLKGIVYKGSIASDEEMIPLICPPRNESGMCD